VREPGLDAPVVVTILVQRGRDDGDRVSDDHRQILGRHHPAAGMNLADDR
jgi:hypothetical protein